MWPSLVDMIEVVVFFYILMLRDFVKGKDQLFRGFCNALDFAKLLDDHYKFHKGEIIPHTCIEGETQAT